MRTLQCSVIIIVCYTTLILVILLAYNQNLYSILGLGQGRPEVIETESVRKTHRVPQKQYASGHENKIPAVVKTKITPQVPGRLGNAMFAYASMMGVAKSNDLEPVFPADHYLRMIFQLTAEPYSTKGIKTWVKIPELASGKYNNRTEDLRDTHADMLELSGYFQCWKYFDHIQKTIKQEFRFRTGIQNEANRFIARGISRVFGVNVTRNDVILIGVHVRKGDMLSRYNQKRGYTMATDSYLTHATSHFEQLYQNSTKKLAFIVCSDNPESVHLNLKDIRSPVLISRAGYDVIDLAILSSCDHSIMTVGTFGWWGAYLAGGHTVYYAQYAKVNSTIYREIEPKDYFYPGWIPML